MDIQIFGAIFAIATALSWYISVPGTVINQRATIPELVFGSLQLSSFFHTALVAYAHVQHPTEPGQPTIESATSSPSSLLPELENVLEKLKEVESNRSEVVFYYQPGTITSVLSWAEPTSGPETGNARMPGGYQMPPVIPYNTMRDSILEIITDNPWTLCWFLFSIIAFIRLTRASKQDADSSCSRAGHRCSNTVVSEGLVEKLNAIDKTTTRTNDRFNDLHSDFASLLQQTRELSRTMEETQDSPQAKSTITTSRVASIENELISLKRSLDTRSSGRDYQFEISDLQTGKLDREEANEQFSSLIGEIRELQQGLDLKTDATEFQEVAKVSWKNESNYTDLGDLLEDKLKVLRQTINSKATSADYESLNAELKRLKVDQSAADDQFSSLSTELETLKTNLQNISTGRNFPQADNEATRNSTLSQPTSDHVMAEIEKLKQDIRDQRAELDSYRNTGSLAKRPEDYPNTESVESKKDAENSVSGEIQGRLKTIQESLDSKADTKSLEDLNQKVYNLDLDILHLKEQQNSLQGAKDTQDLGSRISKLTTEVEELKSSASRAEDQGDSVPIPSYIPSEADIKRMQENIKKVQQDIQGCNSQITELSNSQTSDNELSTKFNDLKRDVNNFRDRVGEVETVKSDLAELKKKLEEMNQPKPSFEEPSQLQLGAFKTEAANTITELRNEIGEKKSASVSSGIQSQLDTFKEDLGKAQESYMKATEFFQHELTGLKTRIDTAEHSLSANFKPELEQLKEVVEAMTGKIDKINPQDLAGLKEKIGAMEQVKTPKGAPHSDIPKIVEDKIRENKDIRDISTLRSRVDVIEKGPLEPLAKNAPKKKEEVDTTIPLLTKLQEIEKRMGTLRANTMRAEEKGFENSGSINKAFEKIGQSFALASSAWDGIRGCEKDIKELTGVKVKRVDIKEPEQEVPFPRLKVIEDQMRINKENNENHGKEMGHLKEAIGKMAGGKEALQQDEKSSPPGPTSGGPGGNSGSSGGGSGQDPSRPDPASGGSGGNGGSKGANPDSKASPPGVTDGGSGGNDGLGGGGPGENPSPTDSLFEEYEESDESDEDSDGDSRPVVSAPTMGNYAVVSPADIKASSSKTDIPSPSTPSIKSDTLAKDDSALDPKNPNYQDKGKEKNPFSKLSPGNQKDEDKDKDQHANRSVLDPMHPSYQDNGKGNNPFAKLMTHDPSHPRDNPKEGQSSDNKKSETPSKSREDSNSQGKDKLGVPPKDKGKSPFKEKSRWDPSYEGEDKLGSPPRKDGEKDPEKRTREDPNNKEDDKPSNPPRKRNKSLNDPA